MNINNLNKIQQSYIFIIVGSILFLYSVGIEALRFVVVIGSLSLILYGLYLGDFLTKFKKIFNDVKNKFKK